MHIVEKKGGSIKKKEKVYGYHSNSESEEDVEEDEDIADKPENDDDDDNSDSDDETELVHKSASGKVYNKDGFEVVPQQKIKKRKPSP